MAPCPICRAPARPVEKEFRQAACGHWLMLSGPIVIATRDPERTRERLRQFVQDMRGLAPVSAGQAVLDARARPGRRLITA